VNREREEQKKEKKKKKGRQKRSSNLLVTDELSVSREYGKRLSNGGTWLGGWVIKGGNGSH
jgi:hypothetical protein